MGGQWTEKCIYTAKQCAPQLCKNGPDWIEPWFVFWSVASFGTLQHNLVDFTKQSAAMDATINQIFDENDTPQQFNSVLQQMPHKIKEFCYKFDEMCWDSEIPMDLQSKWLNFLHGHKQLAVIEKILNKMEKNKLYEMWEQGYELEKLSKKHSILNLDIKNVTKQNINDFVVRMNNNLGINNSNTIIISDELIDENELEIMNAESQ